MPETGLLPTGYVAPRGADLLLQIRADMESTLGVAIDWSADTVLSAITAAIANAMGTVSNGTQAIWDDFDRANAQGMQLDAIGALTGTYREAATYSTATVTLTGTSGAIVPSGSQVQGGGTDGSARWRIGSNVTLTGGSATTTVTAVDPGMITANAGDIAVIVTPIAGWSTVTNAASAVPGRDLESDASYRLRQVQSLQQAGSRSPNAIRGQLLSLKVNGVSVVSSCVVIDNPDANITIIGGLTFPPHSFAPILWPVTADTAYIDAIALVIFANLSPGMKCAGPAVTTPSVGVVTRVTGTDGFPHTVKWYWAVEVQIPVTAALTLATGYQLADVQADVEAAIVAYFAALAVGAPVYFSQLIAAIQAVDPAAILGISLLIDGVAGNYTPALTEIVLLADGYPVVT